MIFPQESQVNLQLSDYKFLIRQNQLLDNPSPVLPLHFDRSYLPKNICQREYLMLVECFVGRLKSAQSCSFQLMHFQRCRQQRDIRILDGIKRWETKHIQSLDKNNRAMYLQGLTFKLNRLKQQYSKIPSTLSKQLKMIQLDSQMQQIKWRMSYINRIIKQQTQ